MAETQTQPMLPSQLDPTPPSEMSGTLPLEIRHFGGLLGAPGPLTGQLVADRYLVLESLGEDERCARYRVRHVRMQKELVLEVLRAAQTDDDARNGFERRLRSASGLDHPAVPPVNDAGALPDGSPYVILERPTGTTLRERLQRDGHLPVDRAVDIALQLCRALDHLHARGLVQGTLDAEHVVLRPGHASRDEARLLRLGEPGAPRRASDPGAGPRDDVRAVAALLYEMITGLPPVAPDATSARWGRRLRAPAMRQRVDGVAVPAALDRVVQRALQPHPADRYSSVARLHEALEALNLVPVSVGAFVRGLPIPLPGVRQHATRARRRRPTARARRRALLGGSLLGAALTMGLALLWTLVLDPRGSAATSLSSVIVPQSNANPAQLTRLKSLVDRGRVREAVSALAGLADRHPTDPRVQLLTGHLHRLQRNPAEALHHYRRAVRLDPRLRSSPELLSAVGQLLSWSAGSPNDARRRREAMAFVHRYLDHRAAPLVTRYVNTWWEAPLVWRGILFLLRLARDQQVDYLYAYELLLRTERSCYKRRAYLKDIAARKDPRFLGLVERVVDAPGWRAPHTGHWIRNTCIQPEARAVATALRTLPHRAVAQTD